MLESRQLSDWLLSQGGMPSPDGNEPEQERDAASCKLCPVAIPLFATVAAMLVLVSLFEWIKHLLVPSVSILQSHIMTIGFTTALAALAAFFIIRHSRRLHEQVLAEMSRRTLTEKMLRANAAFVSRVINGVPAMMAYVDAQMRYRFVNSRYEEWFQKPLEEIVGKSVQELLDPDRFAKVKGQAEQALGGQEVSYEFGYVDRGGISRHIRATYIPDHDENGVILGMFVHNLDISELKRVEEDLRAKHEQLTALAMELTLVEERERRNIAGELHDRVGQALVLGRIKLNSLAADISGDQYAVQLEEVSNLLEQAIQDIRSLSLQLSPPLLYTVGLESALQWLGEEIQAGYGLKVVYCGDEQPKPLKDEVKLAIFQTVRELLINVAKHARATQATVSVSRKDSDMEVVVEDDGIGFDVSEVSLKTGRDGGFGLFNIRQKIEYLGGSLRVESARGAGTRTTITAAVQTAELNGEGIC